MVNLRYPYVLLLFLMLVLSGPCFVRAGSQWAPNSANPILSPGKLGAWDYGGVIRPRVIYDGQKFRMWFVGLDSGGNLNGIGYASSTDGITWVKNSNPVITASTSNWEGSYISIGSVFWTGSEFVMYYRGVGGQEGSASSHGAVGIATSQDGVSWTKYSDNPVMTTGGPDASFLSTPYVIQIGSSYQMWYSWRNPVLTYVAICYASSTDGKSWVKHESPVLVASGIGMERYAVYSPTVVYDGTTYGMWYTATGNSDGTQTQVEFASSRDGITWVKDPSNPIFSYGPSGSWDAGGIQNQCAISYQNGFLLYYDGYGTSDNSLNYIGVAQSPSDFTLSSG